VLEDSYVDNIKSKIAFVWWRMFAPHYLQVNYRVKLIALQDRQVVVCIYCPTVASPRLPLPTGPLALDVICNILIPVLMHLNALQLHYRPVPITVKKTVMSKYRVGALNTTSGVKVQFSNSVRTRTDRTEQGVRVHVQILVSQELGIQFAVRGGQDPGEPFRTGSNVLNALRVSAHRTGVWSTIGPHKFGFCSHRILALCRSKVVPLKYT
jgi:hypothetical protein